MRQPLGLRVMKGLGFRAYGLEFSRFIKVSRVAPKQLQPSGILAFKV